jgi:ketosteroid isomerase-like protein
MRSLRWTTAALILVAACKPAAETPAAMETRMQAETDSARGAIAAADTRYAAFVNAGQADSVAALYVEGGIAMPPHMPMATGRADIAKAITQITSAGKFNLTITGTNLSVNGPVAIERGRFHVTITPPKGPAITDSGKYLAHVHWVNGAWLIAENIWNSDLPLPTMAPARR